jgi:ribosomal protein S12 methylthiotransferase accessory factor
MRVEPLVRLHPRFTHLIASGDTLVLVADEDSQVVHDPLAVAVLPHLDGSRTAPEVAEWVEHDATTVHFVILSLLRHGLAVEIPPDEEVDGPSLSGVAARLSDAWLASAAAGSCLVPPGEWSGPAGMSLLLCDDYLRPEVARTVVDRRNSAGSVGPVLMARIGGAAVWVGPVLGPGAACFDCLADRLRLNLTARSVVHGESGAADHEVRTLRPLVPQEAFQRLADLLPGVAGEGPGRVLRAAGLSGDGDVTDHHVASLPACPSCGDPSLTLPGSDFRLEPRPMGGHSGGGFRIVDPEETLARHGHLLSPLVGVVRRVTRMVAPGPELVHVYTASHAHHYGPGNLKAVRDDQRDHSGGKGRTDLDARASAFCECLERFSFVHRGSEPVRRARASALGSDAIGPEDLLLFSEAQYEGREEWNRGLTSAFQYVPERYRDEEILWSPVRNLRTQEIRFVPSAALYYGIPDTGQPFVDADSNGLAGGNCLEEAILQGFLELVERDAVALWWYNRARLPGVDLGTAEDPWIGKVVELYRSLGRRVWVLDLTHDLEIPTFAALSAIEEGSPQDIIFGFGAHLDARIALTRAMTELNQMLPTIVQERDLLRRRLLPDFGEAIAFWDRATLDQHPYLLPHPATAPRSLADFPRPERGDLRMHVLDCVARAERVGCAVYAHDLTRPDVGFAVAKVFAPGLRHFWRRTAPGRLYDTPVALGWLDGPLDESELNPVSMFV